MCADAPGVPTLDLKTKVLYGAGSVAFGVKDQGFRSFLLIFYNQVVGLPAGLVSTAIMVALVFDAVLDPVIGQISDTWRSRWGRRHPFLYASAVPASISYLLLWNPPTHWSQGAILAYLVVVAVVVRSFITVFEIPSSALVAELTSDYDQRTALMSYRYLFYFWGGLGLNFITFAFLLQPDATHRVGQLNPQGYQEYGFVAAALILVAILISAIGTHRLIPFLWKPPVSESRRWTVIAREMVNTFSHRSFLMILIAAQLKGVVVGLANALRIYIETYFWELSSRKISVLILDGIISSALASVIVPRISKRFGKKYTAMALLMLSFVIGIMPVTLRLLGLFFPNGSPWLVPTLFLNGILLGVTGIGSTILTGSMIADVADDSQLRTGRRSEGLLFSASSLMQKAISGAGVFGSGLILSVVNFPRQAVPGEVAPDVLRNLMLLYLPTLGVLYVLAVLFMSAYRIDRKTHEENLRQLALSSTDRQATDSPADDADRARAGAAGPAQT